jgi:hypothetical protein
MCRRVSELGNALNYQKISEQISQKRDKLTGIAGEKTAVAPFYDDTDTPKAVNIQPDISFRPNLNGLPIKLSDEINTVVDGAAEKIIADVKAKILAYRQGLTPKNRSYSKRLPIYN